MIETVVRLALGLVLIGLNAFFVAAEFALTRLPALDLDPEDVERSPGLRRALEMVDRLELHLTGCQLGISSTSIVLGVVAEPAVTHLIEPVVGLIGVEGASVRPVSVVVAIVLLNLAHKIWGEQAPTYLGVERPRDVAERLAPILYWWSKVMSPVIRLGDGAAKATLGLFGVEVTRSWVEDGEPDGEKGSREEGETPIEGRAELKRRMAELITRGPLPRDRGREVLASLEIDEIPARDVMVPIAEVTPLALDVPALENRRRIAASGHARYPVLERDAARERDLRVEDFAGVIYVPSLFDPPDRLTGELALEELLEEPVRAPADMAVAELIDRFQRARQELALVVEDGEVLGLVTITDALEAIAGQVEDPLDRAAESSD